MYAKIKIIIIIREEILVFHKWIITRGVCVDDGSGCDGMQTYYHYYNSINAIKRKIVITFI